MVKVNYHGRLGNNLFQYCFGRILAEKYNQPLICDKINGFPNIKSIDDKSSYITNTNKMDLLGHYIDINNLPQNTNFILDGYYQRYSYFKYRKDDICRWLLCDAKPSYICEEKDVVVHIRLGDVCSEHEEHVENHRNITYAHHPLPLFYYINAINSFNDINKILILTEKNWIDHPQIKSLKSSFPQYDFIVISDTIEKDFSTIVYANRIIISQSTFAWWSAFLSNATTIHSPLIGFWHPKSNRKINIIKSNGNFIDHEINLIVDDENRYIYHDLCEDPNMYVKDYYDKNPLSI
jgi:hypothetical protein